MRVIALLGYAFSRITQIPVRGLKLKNGVSYHSELFKGRITQIPVRGLKQV